MFGIRVNGGTGAGCKPKPDPDVARCDECGGFISCPRAQAGETLCLMCKSNTYFESIGACK